ncbi:hypothetical protein CIW82_08250 [Acetobacter tropicalis]|uniref:Uncharacterized protein n=1 Tax=Acetobacter tropicalis TaxID=104102 RepID=A0A291PH10_9PROT|nr:hypothetical protein CIW82_08250 [Acetobacter tropicalis]
MLTTPPGMIAPTESGRYADLLRQIGADFAAFEDNGGFKRPTLDEMAASLDRLAKRARSQCYLTHERIAPVLQIYG